MREDLAFRYLAGEGQPDDWTLNDFRTHHAEALQEMFVQVVEVAQGWGMARMGARGH